MATLTIQPSGADSCLFQNDPDANYGTSIAIYIGRGDNSDKRREILKFDFSSLVAGCTISEAKLYLYYSGYLVSDPVGRTYWAYRLTQRSWTETGSSWNHYVGTTDWATAGGDYTATDGASAVVPAAAGWMSWTVTNQVTFAQAYTGKVAHFLMRDGTETSNKIGAFPSNNYTTNTALCPYLILTYTAAGWAHAKNGVVALSNSKINGLVAATGITSVDGII